MDTSALTTKIEAVSTGLTKVSHPIAVLAVVVCFLIYMLTPLLPEWAREHRGSFVKVAMVAVLIGWAPDFITFLMGQ